MTERILIAEDDPDIVELLTYHLRQDGFIVDAVLDGVDALKSVTRRPPSLMVLDLMLPQMSGFDVCLAIKQNPRTEAVSVLILSAKDREEDRVLGLELGADDYVVKPFSPRELILRIRSILRSRNSSLSNAGQLQLGELSLNCSRRQVKAANRSLELTTTEFKFLKLLMEHNGKVQSRVCLSEEVWGYARNTRAVDSYVRRIREKLGDYAAYIETVRGVGYRICIPGG